MNYKKNKAGQRYIIKGKKPELLLLTGMHGDEFGAAKSAGKSIKKYFDKLPDFVFVANCSPSALLLGTRDNGDGFNLNRKFFGTTRSLEAKEIMDLVTRFKFDTCFDLHEDTTTKELYMYDFFREDYKDNLKPKISKFMSTLEKNGIGVRHRWDFVHGYRHFATPDKVTNKNGLFCDWSLNRRLVERYVCLETPTILSQEDKDFLMDELFKSLIL